MKPRNVSELAIVEVEWVDSSHQAGWQYRESYCMRASRQMSVGFVVANHTRGKYPAITISTTVGLARRGARFDGCHTPLSLPWAAVTKFKIIRQPK